MTTETTPTETTETQPQEAPESKYATTTYCVRLTIGKPGQRRGISTSKIEIDADKERITVGKRILDAPEFQAITQLDSALTRWLSPKRPGSITLPSLFKNGVYVTPPAAVERVLDRIKAFRVDRLALCEKLYEAYPQIVEDDRRALRSNFNQLDYPALDALKKAFYVDHALFTFSVPERIANVREELVREEREKAREWVVEVRETAQALLAETFGKLTTHLLERLNGTVEGGKREGKNKVLQESTVEQLWDFFDAFESNNSVAGSAKLAELVADAKAALSGTDRKALQNDEDVRERVRDSIGAINKAIDGLLVDEPERRIDFEDDEPVAASSGTGV